MRRRNKLPALQFDTSGEAVIITAHAKLAHYLGMLTSQLPIESQVRAAGCGLILLHGLLLCPTHFKDPSSKLQKFDCKKSDPCSPRYHE